jgi:hypothetical protein
MINFIELVNHTVRVAKPLVPDFNGVKTLNDPLKECGIDSLDWLIVMIYLCEIYGIPEAVGKEFYPITIQDLHDELMKHKTREPETIEEALSYIK